VRLHETSRRDEMVRDPPRDSRRFGSRPRRDSRRIGPRPRRDRDVGHFGRDETETRRWYVSRPSRDRDVETETTSLPRIRVFAYVYYRVRDFLLLLYNAVVLVP